MPYQGNKNGTPLYKKDKSGDPIAGKNGQPVLDEDFSTVCQEFRNYQNGRAVNTDFSFSADYSRLNGRFDYDYYSPQHRRFFDELNENNSVRLGDICTIIKDKSSILKHQELSVEYVELSDVNSHSFEIINSTSMAVHELPSRASYEIKTGDILTAIAGNSVGTRKHATAFVSPEYNGCLCTNGFRVLRHFKIDPYYFLFFLRSESFLKQMYMLRTGAAIPNVSDSDLADIRVFIPSSEKIEKISNALKKSFDLRVLSRQMVDQISFLD
jgi:type I restriction enzyme M protein